MLKENISEVHVEHSASAFSGKSSDAQDGVKKLGVSVVTNNSTIEFSSM